MAKRKNPWACFPPVWLGYIAHQNVPSCDHTDRCTIPFRHVTIQMYNPIPSCDHTDVQSHSVMWPYRCAIPFRHVTIQMCNPIPSCDHTDVQSHSGIPLLRRVTNLTSKETTWCPKMYVNYTAINVYLSNIFSGLIFTEGSEIILHHMSHIADS